MARGDAAKIYVENKIKEAFGSNYIGIMDKKIYVWGDNEGEKMQIAISLTCPKNQIEVVDTNKLDFSNPNAGLDFENMDAAKVLAPAAANEITEEEKDNIASLMASLGLL